MSKLRVLDLFSGIGGFSLGLERTGGFETVAFCEIEPYCRKVLAKHWPKVPCYEDVRSLTADTLARDGIAVDVICGGFPCTNISSSGDKTGITGKDSFLYREMVRLVCELRPSFAIMENVSDLLARGLGDVLGELASSGYDAEWHSIPGAFVGLPQARERVWIVAYPDGGGRQGRPQRYGEGPIVVVRNDDDRLAVGQHWARHARSWVRRADGGIPNRMDRVAACGRSAAPQVTELIGQAILASLQQDQALAEVA